MAQFKRGLAKCSRRALTASLGLGAALDSPHRYYLCDARPLLTDYLRGRMIKPLLKVFPDGRIVLQTHNRGEAATRWVQRLQGKKVPEVVEDAFERTQQ